MRRHHHDHDPEGLLVSLVTPLQAEVHRLGGTRRILTDLFAGKGARHRAGGLPGLRLIQGDRA